jgi:heme/copper-type cytochrome/quinol oxidase subunit 3
VILVAPRSDRPLQRSVGRPHETVRGRWGMWLLVATEAMLFVFLFFAYFYLGLQSGRWPGAGESPSLGYALPMLGILLVSSGVLHWGERGIVRGRSRRLAVGLGVALLLGAIFLTVQFFEYREHLKHLTPRTDAYGSIFYAITSLHMAHVVVGMLVLLHTLARTLAGHFDEGHHVAVQNASLYWHFVDAVWVCVVAVLYVGPRLS